MLLDIERSRSRSRPRPADIPRVYLKAPPSEIMLESDGKRRRCEWLEHGVTIHSDGNVSCGLDDPHAERSFGNIERNTIAEIFNGPEYDRLRQKLWNGYRCRPCALYEEVQDYAPAPPPKATVPTTLIVEPTVRCNILCDNGSCSVNNDRSVATREVDDLDVGAFARVVDEIGAELKNVFFFNYGDPFMHRSAEDMLIHLREQCPDALIVTSTNGIPLLKPERAAKVAQSRVDQITFTISGVTQESYVRYHGKGSVEHALQGLRNVCEARNGDATPRVEWRYLVFNWNDSFEEIDRAIALADDMGVDRFTLFLTHIPVGSTSWRLGPGSEGFDRYKNHIEHVYGYDNHVVPDADGFHGIETLPHLGEARWTARRSRMSLPERGGAIRLAISTNRAAHRPDKHFVLIRAPWQVYRVAFVANEWTDVTIPVPEGVQGLGPYAIEMIAEEVWFPIEELGSEDRRTLGVLVEHGSVRRESALRKASPTQVARFAI